jgi:YegS/Rv2252/BmrU family lipid kinase
MAYRAIKACLITNPKSGRGGVDLSEAIAVLREHGWEVMVRQKLHGGHATELARDALAEGCNVVVDCGGDGTLNEIVEGVVGTDVAVGVLPGGTANLWAHEATIPRRLGEAARQMVGAERRRVDVGKVAVNGKHKGHFLLMAGVGFDGAVLGRISKPLKNRIGKAAYLPAIAGALRTFRPVPVYAKLDEIDWRGKTSQVIIGNTRSYAGFTRTTPTAYVDDGLLDVCLITATGPASVARQLTTLTLRQRPSPTSAYIYRAATVMLRSATVLPLQVDGGHIHLGEDERTANDVIYTFGVTALGVTLLVPSTYGGALFQPAWLADELAGTALRPVRSSVVSEIGAGHDGHVRRNGHGRRDDRGPKEKRWHLVVLATGVDSITATRLKNGRTVQVIVAPSTVLTDAGGGEHPLWGSLSALAAGDQIEAAGHKDAEQGTFVASRIALRSERGLPHAARRGAWHVR